MLLRSVMRVRQQFAVITKYTKEHEWIRYDTDKQTAKIGITDYAQKELGDIVHIDVPKIGLVFKQNQSIGAIESVKVAADIYAPVAGEVLSLNEVIKDNPSLINQDADNNWIFKAKVTTKSELDQLLDQTQYLELIKSK